ncbi:HesA/MoeB/ThiF family protein [Propionibacteriaceae bacterium Y1923]
MKTHPEALVAEARELSPDERHRHSRTIAIPAFGEQAQARLRAASVAVVGAGGLGSPVLTYLVGAGIGRLTIIDNDVVEVHNLQRQVVHGTGSVGVPKVTSAANRLRDLNPEVEIVERDLRLEPTNALAELGGHDLLVDATDNLPVRFAMADAAEQLDLPVVYGSVSSTRAQVTVFRKSWGIGLRDLLDEDQQPGVTKLDDVGVFAPLTGIAGSWMAVEAVKLICGIGDPLIGRVLYLDALTADPQVVPLVAHHG